MRLKRVADVLVSAMLLIITSPLVIVAGLLIKLMTMGLFLFWNGQVFTDSLIKSGKLRTMRTDAEQNGAQWSSRADSRITKIGAFLGVQE